MKTLLTIPPEMGEKITEQARLRGLPIATTCRCLIRERLEKIDMPAAAAKQTTGIVATPDNSRA